MAAHSGELGVGGVRHEDGMPAHEAVGCVVGGEQAEAVGKPGDGAGGGVVGLAPAGVHREHRGEFAVEAP